MIKLTDELTMDLAVMFKAVPVTALECEGKTVDVLTLAQSGVIVVRDGKPVTVPETLCKILSEAYGANTAGFNETFHKSFSTVANMTPEEYFFHQILHYFTTYGAESVGVNIPTYVRAEALELPEGMLPVNKLTVIQTLTEEELVKQMSQFAMTTKAPNEAQKSAMQRFLPYVTVSTENMESFEFQVMAHGYRGTVPENPVSVLRYLIYKTTGGTLIIKSPRLIEAIRDEAETADDTAYEILKRANEIALAEVFLRYKPILLAYKQYPGCAPIINRIRRLAVRHHKPLSDEAFQNVIQLALAGRDDAVERLVNQADNRDLIKLANAVMLRCFALSELPGVYMVRNGRIFVRSGALRPATTMDDRAAERLSSLFNKVKALLIERLRPSVEGKTFFIPEYVSYAAPYTEKQMMGHIPYGSRIMTGQDGAFTAGIHWVNQQKCRIDLDLHMRSKNEHFGWNGGFRVDDKVIFTGDQTDAPEPNGAAEAFWFEPEANDVYILSVNEFSGPDKAKFEFVVSTQKPAESDIRSKNFTYDPAKIAFAPVPLQFNDSSDMSIGMFVCKTFYVYGGVLGDGIVPSENSEDLIDGMRHVLEQRLQLADLLKAAGAVIVNDMGELPEGVAEENVVNLAPQAVTSTLLFSLVDGTYGSADGKAK
jgi:hypothetical protein